VVLCPIIKWQDRGGGVTWLEDGLIQFGMDPAVIQRKCNSFSGLELNAHARGGNIRREAKNLSVAFALRNSTTRYRVGEKCPEVHQFAARGRTENAFTCEILAITAAKSIFLL
jgi:hypothetical protein